MDWDVEPTAFSEYVPIATPIGQIPAELQFSSNDGFAHPDPLTGPADLGATGIFHDVGPFDHGALFDLAFPTLDPGSFSGAFGDSVTFTMYYGAAGSEAEALAAIDAVGADLYSLAQPDVAGVQRRGEPSTSSGPTVRRTPPPQPSTTRAPRPP